MSIREAIDNVSQMGNALCSIVYNDKKRSDKDILKLWQEMKTLNNRSEGTLNRSVISFLTENSPFMHAPHGSAPAERVLMLYKSIAFLKEVNGALYDELVDESFILSMMWGDICGLFATASFSQTGESVHLTRGMSDTLVLTGQKLKKLGRELTSAQLAYNMLLRYKNEMDFNHIMIRPTIFLERWSELSQRPVNVYLTEEMTARLVGLFDQKKDGNMAPGAPVFMPNPTVQGGHLLEMIEGVEHFEKAFSSKQLTEAIIGAQNPEIIMAAAEKNLICSDESEYAINAALNEGVKNVVPYLILYKWRNQDGSAEKADDTANENKRRRKSS